MIHLEALTLRHVLERSARLYPDRIALSTVEGTTINYAALRERVQTLSHLLHERGIIPGDRVAILSENQPNWGIAYFAITSMGAVAVPILPDFHPNEILHILRHAECKAILVSRRMFAGLDEVESLRISTVVLLDDFTLVPPRTSPDRLSDLIEEGKRDFAKLKEAALRFAGRIPATVREDDLAAIVYTSGTTGHSKGVMLTHRNIVSNAQAATRIVTILPEDRMLSILPLSHTYECTVGLVTPILAGASVYYLDKLPSAAVLLPAMAAVKPTIMLSVPLVIEKIYKGRILPQLHGNTVVKTLYGVPFLRKKFNRMAGKKLFASFGGELRIFCIGGAALAPDVESFLREARFPYAVGYGLTETSPIVAGAGPEETRYRSTGRPVHGASVKIEYPDPVSGEGEILVKGPMVMIGYYKDPARTAEVLDAEGWFRTGDLGVFDTHGFLYIKGRLKNLILGASGKNIYPEEIESTINEFDVVVESLVFAQNAQIVARVHLNYEKIEGILGLRRLTESQIRERIKKLLEDLRRQVNERVSAFSRIHRIIEQTEPFEKTPTQKIKRHLYA